MNETLYRKVGRRYVPVLNSRTYERDTMHVNTWRMVYVRAEMAAAGGMLPVCWVHTSAEDVAKAAIKAVEEWRDE